MQMAPNVVVDSQPPLAMPQGTPPVSDQPTMAHSITTLQFQRTTSNYMTPTCTSSAQRSGAVTPPSMFEGNNGGNSFGSPKAFRRRDKQESTPLIQCSPQPTVRNIDVPVVAHDLIPPLDEPHFRSAYFSFSDHFNFSFSDHFNRFRPAYFSACDLDQRRCTCIQQQ
jgi:hypothetical protein